MKTRKKFFLITFLLIISLLFFSCFSEPAIAKNNPTFNKNLGRVSNEMIYQKVIEIEKRLFEIEKRLGEVEKRQAILEAEFKDFKEETNKRFEYLKEYMDKRFEDVNKRFEDMNKRFEDINKRFHDVISFLRIMTVVFGGLVVAILAFALWDRRTFIKKAKEEMDREWEVSKVKALIHALRELAKEDPKVAKVLKDFHLL